MPEESDNEVNKHATTQFPASRRARGDQIDLGGVHREQVSLKLLQIDYHFTLSFPATYPDKPPQANGADFLQMGILAETKQRLKLLRSALRKLYVPGEEVLYDTVSTSHHMLPISELATKKVRSAVFDGPEFQQNLANSPNLVKNAELLKMTSYTACMDEMLVEDMARVTCDHFHCSGCLQMGIETSVAMKKPLDCCKQRIPTDIHEDMKICRQGAIHSYADFLEECDTLDPVYCAYKKRWVFILLRFIRGEINSLLELFEENLHAVPQPQPHRSLQQQHTASGTDKDFTEERLPSTHQSR